MFSDRSRGQTEPLAALVAVSAVAIGIGLYAGYIAGVLPGASGDTVEEPTIQRAWSEIQEDGLYHENDRPLRNMDERAIPRGETVFLEVSTAEDDAEPVIVEQALYAPNGTYVQPGSDVPPEHGREVTRPIPVRTGPGDVRAGTLRVVVW